MSLAFDSRLGRIFIKYFKFRFSVTPKCELTAPLTLSVAVSQQTPRTALLHSFMDKRFTISDIVRRDTNGPSFGYVPDKVTGTERDRGSNREWRRTLRTAEGRNL